MKPEPARFLEVAAAHLMTKTAPAITSSYEQASAALLSGLLMALNQEFERAAARRVEENRALRVLFSDAAPLAQDGALRERLERAACGAEMSFAVSDLERANAELRALLIDLHAHVEQVDSPQARRVEAAIWRELVRSTERRRLDMGPV